MRTRAVLNCLAAMFVLTPPARAQDSRRTTAGVLGRDNLRFQFGQVRPVGGMRDWNSGAGGGLSYEAWSTGPGDGNFDAAAGITGNFARLPFNEAEFLQDFQSPTGSRATRANASSASFADLAFTIRVRGPIVYVVPSAMVAVGYYNFHPSTVNFHAPDTSGTTKFRTKQGGLFGAGGGLDTPPIGRAALFAEVMYEYGWSSESQFAFAANSRCSAQGCDVFKATQTLTTRGGVRLRLGR
jgi:hypothetical protein